MRPTLSTWVRRWFHRRSDDDFAAEVESHLALEADRLIQSGMSPDEAWYAARRAFGNLTASRERFHDTRPGVTLETLAQDVRYGLRTLRRSPGFTAVAVASLAIGIGANTTMFGAVDRLLIRTPAHVRDADRVHRVYFRVPMDDGGTVAVSHEGYRTYLALRERVHGLDAVGAQYARSVSSGHGAGARSFSAVLATPSLFPMLGVRPALGRFFDDSEERDDGTHVVVLGHHVWRDRFAGDSAVLGRTMDVGGVPHTIIGVAPEDFTGIDLDRVDLWLPIGVANRLLSPRAVSPTGGGYWLDIVARRRPDVSPEQLAAEITTVYRDARRDAGPADATVEKTHAELGPVVAARGPRPDAAAMVSIWVGGVSLLVLLVACANVANLLLLRGLTRARETALRLSLGASRRRLARQALVEGLLLAAAGATCALLVARWSATAMHAFLLPRVERERILEPGLLLFTAVVALGTGLLASVVPAFVAARGDFGPLLSAGRAAGARNRLVLQRALIGAQVALATSLLVGAGLFVTSLQNVRAIDLGLDVDHLLYVKLDEQSGPGKGGATGDALSVYRTIVDRVRQVPGIASATLTAGEPLTSGWGVGLSRRGAPPLAPGTPVPMGRAVGRDYFETMGTPLRRGRFFTPADHVPNAHVAIVDETTAARVWPNGDPLDPCAHLDFTEACTQIVGVVANTVQWEITGERGSVVYVPLEAWPDHAPTMMEVRTTGDPAASIPAVRQAMLSAWPDMPWMDIRPLSERLAPQLRPWRLGATMFTVFGLLALGLAAVGLYGLLSYAVARRAHEIGVRKALGAPTAGIVGIVVRGGLGMALPGLGIGVGVALGASRLIASQLYGVSPRDPMIILLAVAGLVVTAVIACLLPARRATRVDPVVALRAE